MNAQIEILNKEFLKLFSEAPFKLKMLLKKNKEIVTFKT